MDELWREVADASGREGSSKVMQRVIKRPSTAQDSPLATTLVKTCEEIWKSVYNLTWQRKRSIYAIQVHAGCIYITLSFLLRIRPRGSLYFGAFFSLEHMP